MGSAERALAASEFQIGTGRGLPAAAQAILDSIVAFLSSIETRSAPAVTRCYPCSFTFYLGNPFPRFLVSLFECVAATDAKRRPGFQICAICGSS